MSLATLKGGIEMGRKKKAKEVETMVEDTIETVEPEVTEEVIEETVEPEVTEEVEEVVEPEEEIIEMPKGKIIANKLYLRSGPSKDSEPSEILTKNTEVFIDEQFKNKTFYKVVLDNGTEGYCVKEFIDMIK